MTEPLDLDAIETEVRAYVAAYDRQHDEAQSQHIYLRGLLAIIRQRDDQLAAERSVTAQKDAEIARLEEVAGDAYEKHYQEVSRLRAELDARDAEISRLRALSGAGAERYRHKKRGTTYVVLGKAEIQAPEHWPLIEGETAITYRCEQTGELWARRTSEFHDGRFERLPDAVAAPPGADVMAVATRAWYGEITKQPTVHGQLIELASALQQYGDERAWEAIREKDAEIARLRELFEATRRWGQHAPPGGDVLELARNTFRSLGVAVVTSEAVEAVASALQRYGDERAAAAREAAIEEAARWLAPNFPGQARDMVRALTAKPGSET